MVKLPSIIKPAVACMFFFFIGLQLQAQKPQSTYADTIMQGISNHGHNPDKPYVTAGDRSYIIGSMDGNFPDMGDHVRGEMGGLWLPPIKLLDGFWLRLDDLDDNKAEWLSNATDFINYPYGNKFKYGPLLNGLRVERTQLCPDNRQGMIIQFKITNPGSQKRVLNLDFLAKTDISPAWFSKEAGINDSRDNVSWVPAENYFLGKDSLNSWAVVWGATISGIKPSIGPDNGPVKTIGNGISASCNYRLSIKAHSDTTIVFIVAGSANGKNEAITAYKYLKRNYRQLSENKKKHFLSVLNSSRISIPDKSLQEVYNWVKINTEWLVRDVPGTGRGLSAGFMEYPWWFGCDNTYALQAVMATGNFDLCKQTLRLLKNKSMMKNGNGRIVHEISTNGTVANPGNTQETAHFIMCVQKLYEWTGDNEFIKEMYPVMQSGLKWLLTDMDENKNMFPEGYGIMEVSGLNAELIDVAVYTQQALKATAEIARALNDFDNQTKYQQLADKLQERINLDYWDDKRGTYCDFYGTRAQAIQAAEGAITQLKKQNSKREDLMHYYEGLKKKYDSLKDTTKGWSINDNWVINTPMETGIAPQDKAIRLLDKIRKENTGQYGPYLSAVERTHMMTIATGVQAVAEYRYGRTDESLWYMNKIVQTFSRVLPGSISEMMPDYGCFTQAWTNYGIVLPLVRHMFGIQPDAGHKVVILNPHLPSGWKDKPVSITDLPVGDNEISFARSVTPRGTEYKVSSKKPLWKMILKIKSTPGNRYFLNGKATPFAAAGFKMNRTKNRLLVVSN